MKLSKKLLAFGAASAAVLITAPFAIFAAHKAHVRNVEISEYVKACTPHIEGTRNALTNPIAAQNRFSYLAEQILQDGRVNYNELHLVSALVQARGARIDAFDVQEDAYFGDGFFSHCEEPRWIVDDEGGWAGDKDHLVAALPEVDEVLALWETHRDANRRANRNQQSLNRI